MIFKIINLIMSFPKLIEFYFHLEKKLEAAEEKRKVSDDLKKINQAFKTKDAQALRDTFNAE